MITKTETLSQKLALKKNRKNLADTLSDNLRSGRTVTDFEFDQIYPNVIRKLSETYWTPLEVVLRAAELLSHNGKTRILDVGSGCGKFCTIGALSTPGQFIGVEHRPHLAKVAQKVAKELGASRATFIQGDLADVDWSFFNSFYLYNPFYEYKTPSLRMDDTVPMGWKRFEQSIATVRTKLQGARIGAKVVIYHGFGGDMPQGYRQLKKEPMGSSCLELWIKI